MSLEKGGFNIRKGDKAGQAMITMTFCTKANIDDDARRIDNFIEQLKNSEKIIDVVSSSKEGQPSDKEKGKKHKEYECTLACLSSSAANQIFYLLVNYSLIKQGSKDAGKIKTLLPIFFKNEQSTTVNGTVSAISGKAPVNEIA